jgi:hypothetical protein
MVANQTGPDLKGTTVANESENTQLGQIVRRRI